MAKVVIELEDMGEDGSVEFRIKSEPPLDVLNECTEAQIVAMYMLMIAKQAAEGKDDTRD